MNATHLGTGGGKRRIGALWILPIVMAVFGVHAAAWGGTVLVTNETASTSVDYGTINLAIPAIQGMATDNDTIKVELYSNQSLTSPAAGWDFGDGNGNGYKNLTISTSVPNTQLILTYSGIGGSPLMTIDKVVANGINNSLTLRDLVFNTGNYTDATGNPIARGAGLYVLEIGNGAVVSIANVDATGNTIDITANGAVAVGANGGGLYLDGRTYTAGNPVAGNPNGRVVLNDVNLTNNSVATDNTGNAAGSSANGGGGLINSVADLSYSNSTVSGNSATAVAGSHAHGGGLSLEYSRGNANADLTSVDFTNNKATVDGAVNNVPVARGGGLYVLNENFNTNEATTLRVNQGTFQGNEATAKSTTGNTNLWASGGAVSLEGAVNAEFNSVDFNNNSAIAQAASSTARGGAIAQEGTLGTAAGSGDVKIIDGQLVGNKATATGTALGGAVYVETGTLKVSSTAPATKVAFTGNVANTTAAAGQVRGGAVALLSDKAHDIANANFSGNKAGDAGSTAAQALGGAVYYQNITGTTTISGTEFNGNQAESAAGSGVSRGGAVHFGGTPVATLDMTATDFIGNKAIGNTGFGGAVYAVDGSVKLTNAARLTGNEAATAGGAIYSASTNATTTVELNNTAATPTDVSGNKALAGNGGAIYADAAKVKVTNAAIAGNTANLNGGAIYANTGDVDLSRTSLTGNTATNGVGGAIYSVTGSSVKIADAASVSNNTANNGGGAIYSGSTVNTATVELTNATATPTSVTGNTTTTGNGGAIYVDAAKVSVTNVSLNTNKAVAGSGGAVYAASNDIALTRIKEMKGNEARTGGAVYSASTSSTTTVTLDNSATTAADISGNKATLTSGGAIFANAAKVSVTNASLNTNTAATTGGAIYAATNDIALTNIGAMMGNEAQSGGAIYSASTSPLTTVKLDNSAFTAADLSGNRATTGSGGVIYTDAAGINLTNIRADGNTANVNGGAFFSNTGLVSLKDATLSNNKATTGNGGAIFSGIGNVDLTNAVLTGNEATVGNGGAIYMNLSAAQAASLKLTAENGRTSVIAGNRDASGVNQGVYFGGGGTGPFTDTFTVDTMNSGRVSLLDSTVVINSVRNFTFAKAGTGTLDWNSANTFTTAGVTTIDLKSGGTVNLGRDFSAVANGTGDYTVNIGDSGSSTTTLAFDTSRAANTASAAMFTFDNTGNKQLNIDNVNIHADLAGTNRQLLSFDASYAIATDIAQPDVFLGGLSYSGMVNGVWYDSSTSTLWANVRNSSPYDYAGVNATSAKYAAARVARLPSLTDDQFWAIYNNPWAVTPELYMDQSRVMLDSVSSVADRAVYEGLIAPYRAQNVSANATPPRPRGYATRRAYGATRLEDCYGPPVSFRIFGGYIGDWSGLDTHGGFNGYTTDRDGFIVGGAWDIGTVASIGAYAGYTHQNTKARQIRAEVEADAGHFGLMGRFSPIPAAPGFSIYGDLGYHFSNNSTWRGLGGYVANGSFDQDALTAGLSAEYAIHAGAFHFTPAIKARYTYVDQDGMQEKGLTATNISGFNANAFNTRVGFEAAYDLNLRGTVITPSVHAYWRHEYGTTSYGSDSYYIQDPTPIPFTVQSSRIDRDSADIGTAIKAYLNVGGAPRIGLTAGYNLNVSRHQYTHSLYLGAEVGF